MARHITAGLAAALIVLTPGFAWADNLYQNDNWPSLASDRKASEVGDILTVIILANSTASNTVAKGTKRNTDVGGAATFGDGFNESASLSFGGGYDGQGTTTRADRMAAQLSATVYEVLPNGDMLITGWQQLKINGETTNIKVSGRVRPADLDSQNAVLSSRIGDAFIEYDGKGFSSRSAKPGIVTRILNFLGLV